MPNKTTPLNQKSNKNNLLLLGSASIVAVLLAIWGGYHLGYAKSAKATPKVNTPAYVIGDQASQHVENFLTQYINPKTLTVEKIINSYGDNNLAFYRAYYQHGFDPITCSTVKAVKASPVSSTTGATSTVQTKVDYEDGTSQIITSNVVLNDQGIRIDSIMCPGEKGNLPPQ